MRRLSSSAAIALHGGAMGTQRGIEERCTADLHHDLSTSSRLWYKDAVIYQVHVRAFRDSNGDGTGDFPGLTEKLGYLRDLGVTALWLLPFYPSPLRDDGYDIAYYLGIHPSYGTLDDFHRFISRAHTLGIRVITELVVNHTSDQHPWFQMARRSPRGSAEREFYVWSDSPERFNNVRVIFSDIERSNWTWDAAAQQYFWHRFFSHQPDLNHNNPEVIEQVINVMRFWFDLGVDGMRLDAIPYLCVRDGTDCTNLPETHTVLRTIRAAIDAQYQEKMLLAEANLWPEDLVQYFGAGNECHMAFNFPLMPRLYMAIRQESAKPILDILNRTPSIPPTCQWALFLRNHDELTLEMVTDTERDYLYREYAQEPQMRLNSGIRRRLAPLLHSARRRIELMNSLLLSFLGTPIIYYGDELGMGDNVYLGDRAGVRTPMQWSADVNAGFSSADPALLYLPVITEPEYSYQHINVEIQERNPSSLLHFMRRMIRARQAHPCFGRGSLSIVPCDNPHVLAYLREWRDDVVLVVVNLSRFVQPISLTLPRLEGRVPREKIGGAPFPPIGSDPYFMSLGPHGFYWFTFDEVGERQALG